MKPDFILENTARQETAETWPHDRAAVPVDAAMQLAQHQAFLAAATSSNTRRTYRSAVKHFFSWGGMLPADEQTMVGYLLAYAGALNSRTLALRLTALSRWHVHQGFPDPAATPTVRKTLVGIMRTCGKPRRKAKALPVEDLEHIVAILGGLGTLNAARDSALLQIGFFAGLRRSELVGLDVNSVRWEPQGITITLPRSKTDQSGEGIFKSIPYGDVVSCPATALRVWLDSAGITTGPVFRPITRWGKIGVNALHGGSVNTILAACAELAKLDYVPELSSHSLRRGMATSAHLAGADFREIKRQGGWRHDGTVHGYIEEASRFSENAAGTLLRRKSQGA